MNRNNNKPRKRRGLINPDKTKTYKVYQECTLLDFVKMKLPQQSEKNCKRIIMNHQVGVNGAPVSIFKAPLYKEDEVTLAWKPIRRYKRDNLPIIYEDDELIVIDKPSGLLSVASDKEKRRTAYRMVADYLSYKDPNSRCFIVHRLDEDTSGVLLFAKNNIIRTALQHQWNDIVNAASGQWQSLKDTFGWDDSSATGQQQSATSRAFGTEMTQEQGAEISGRLTALYDVGLQILSSIQSMSEISTSITSQSAIMSEIRNIAVSSNGHLFNIVNYQKKIWNKINVRLDEITNTLKNGL